MTTIANNLQQLHARIARACAAAGRDTHSVALLAVSKTFGPEAVREAAQTGQRAFGENYLQEAVEKIALLRTPASWEPPLQWHCIGPVQSNKTRLVAEYFDWMHTVDRLKIAQRLSEQRPAHLPPLQVCIQVNIDGSSSKSGVAPTEALALAQAIATLPRLQLRGLMAIPEPAPDFHAQYAIHMAVRELFDQIKASGSTGLEQWDTLSLGMTADLEAAILAGSTLVRVGSGIFGERHYPAA
ncbi:MULTISPECIES: YggS family pyridoxal phosphate-dependent enzyme [Giesbergeria]|uniref:Pyridoxal phosphate homeostasis protein n=1 Tax=Giesbergeria sinuosa TaxID=80883 RepID=A0ABV9Q9U4_9BURK